MKKVLMIGDSIRLGYQAKVAELLNNKDVKRYISGDMVHLTKTGNSLCASRVADLVQGTTEP